MPFYFQMSGNITQQRDIYDTVVELYISLLSCIYIW